MTDPSASCPDLIVYSHLRWSWVWQRPQHLISRIARRRATEGGRTWFVEEPLVTDADGPRLSTEDTGDVTRVVLEIPEALASPGHQHFDSPGAAPYGDLLSELAGAAGAGPAPDAWLYTPLALELARRVGHGRLVFDVMDDLSAFQNAPAALRLAHRRALTESDLVFTGGRSLHRGVRGQRSDRVYLFASGVDGAHYAASNALRTEHARPVAGYVGVVDERLDLRLIADLARRLPDWTVRMVGPVAKIAPADLPQEPNLQWTGPAAYDELPAVMAGFDVGLMPFARNEATRSISPTKSLEYLAAGLPVVSTPVPDVVADLDGMVCIAELAADFAAGCREALAPMPTAQRRRIRRLLAEREWDAIADRMRELLEQVGTDVGRPSSTSRRVVSA
jgi:glycosyltransferase involved in cell wall biosynthesis